MKTLAQVRQMFLAHNAEEFQARLYDRVMTKTMTETEEGLYRKRMERALELALAPAMMRETSPGVWDVWSTGKTQDKVWTVGDTCNCPDADPEKGKAPKGHCKHRLAVWLQRRATENLKTLEARMEGLKLPHLHTYECGHKAEPCFDAQCTTAQEEALCADCNAPDHARNLEEERQRLEDAVFGPDTPEAHRDEPVAVPLEPGALTNLASLDPPAQYEVPTPYERKADPLPEAPASLNLKVKHHNVEVMMTLRAHTDAEILARLPAVLEGLSKVLGVKFTNE